MPAPAQIAIVANPRLITAVAESPVWTRRLEILLLDFLRNISIPLHD